MTLDLKIAAEYGAAMIAKNEGRDLPNDIDRYHAQWAIAGLLQYHRELKASAKGAAAVAGGRKHDGGGNIHETGPTALGGPESVLREQSKMQGYVGDACGNCGNFTLARNGTCLKCMTCGETTGCS